MRLFIAISLSDEIRKSLVKTQDFLSRHGIRGSLVPRENLHMTLTFIGEHPDPDQVLEVMENVDFPAFSITLNDIGIFNNNVLWAGVHESEPLQKLVKNLRYELAKADIPFDRKAFMPHHRKPTGSMRNRISQTGSRQLQRKPSSPIRKAAICFRLAIRSSQL